MKQLIIAEKPSLAREIVKAIGNMTRKGDYYENERYIVISVFGHLLTLWDLDDYIEKDNTKWNLNDLNFFPEKFKYKVKDDEGIKRRFELIKSLIARSDVDTIVNAGDSDREGEVLINIVVYNIFNELRLKKKVTRIWLEEQTEATIRKELHNPRPIENTQNLFNEGRARMFVDWLYGIYITRFISIKSGTKLNAGRVIIPTVKFIYDRDMEIKNFVPTKYYKINCSITTKNGENVVIDFKDMKYDLEHKADAQRLEYELKNNPIIVSNVEQKDVEKLPKRLFSLPSLQNYMNKNFKWSLKKTLNVAQSLYEQGYTTYPRTNTEYLAEEEKEKYNNIIKQINDSELIRNYWKFNDNDFSFSAHKRLFDSSKVESHSAITITTKIPSLKGNNFSDEERTLYRTIFNRCLANFYDEKCIVAETKVTFLFKGYDENYTTSIKGRIIKQKGYLLFENDLMNKSIYQFKTGEQYYCNSKLEIKTTKPPSKVTEDELNKYYEKPFKKDNIDEENTDEDYKNILNGVEIGTSATRADTLEKCKNIGYIELKRNALSITEKGIAFINILNMLNINLWAEQTALLSKELKRVYKNELTVNEIVSSTEIEIRKIISSQVDISNEITNAKEIIGYCPLCNRPVYENKKSFGCSGYKDGCKFVIWKIIAGKNITKIDAKDLLDPKKNYTTKKKKGFLSKTGKSFDAKLYTANDGTINFEFN